MTRADRVGRRVRGQTVHRGRGGARADFEPLEARRMLSAQVYDGPLNGKIVFTGAGHGWQWSSVLGRYATERGDNHEVVEDLGNQEQMSLYADYLLRAGATVVPLRPIGHQLNEVIVDNDSPGVVFGGDWNNSTNSRYYDEDYGAVPDNVPYRWANTSAGGHTATATYTPDIPQEGFYPVYTWVLRATDRTTQLYQVRHTGGMTEIRVDHSKVGSGWVYLGTYHFDAGSAAGTGSVTISNNGPAGKVVIADAIRFGNGMGDYIQPNTGATTISGFPREEENSYHWIARSLGVGTTMDMAIGAGWLNVSAPTNFSQYMFNGSFGEALYIGFHSNAGGGRGAVGLIDSTYPTPNQAALALYTGRQINQDMQALNGRFEHNWSTRTVHTYTGRFGEIDLRLNAEMDATIIEVAFHDSSLDAQLMRDPKVRDQLARSTYEATLEYFGNFGGVVSPVSQPDQPRDVRARANPDGSIMLNWSAPESRPGGPAAAAGYRIYTSRNGYGFGEPITVGANVTEYTLPAGGLDVDPYYFKVAAINEGGEGPGSAVVGARRNGTGGGGGTNRILIVNGFDRFERTQNLRQPYAYTSDGLIDRVRPRYNNTFDYVVRAGEAIAAYSPGDLSLGFDSAQNEHIISGAVDLSDYQTVIWLNGEESTRDDTFDLVEQQRISTYLDGGGRLFVSGSEIGWDLAGPTSPAPAPTDVSFYNNVLRASFVADAANSYTATGVTGSIFAGLNLNFEDGSNHSNNYMYNVRYADVIAPSAGSVSAMTYTGGIGGGAAVQYSSEQTGARLVYMGFPFEAITTSDDRNLVMERVLEFFQTPVNPATVEGRAIFYNRSVFDGNNSAAGAADDLAIATDKSALLPGQTATFANFTSYSRGINGLMIDVAGLPAESLSAADFMFRVGNNDNPSTWSIAPAPTGVTVRTGAGQGGSDRVTLIFADNAIQKTWLQVTVLANANTGLAAEDVFYFGNAVGETGNDLSQNPAATFAAVNALDSSLVVNNFSGLATVPITSHYDIDRSGRVNATDASITINNPSGLARLRIITVPPAGPLVQAMSSQPEPTIALPAADPIVGGARSFVLRQAAINPSGFNRTAFATNRPLFDAEEDEPSPWLEQIDPSGWIDDVIR